MVHHFLVCCPHWTFWHRWLFHVPEVFKSVSKSGREIDTRLGRALCGELFHLWNDEAKLLLNELVVPVPELFRPVAKQKIAGKIGEIALGENAKKIDSDLIIRGYIQATPKRDHKFLRKKMAEMKIDLTPYEHLF